MSGVWLNANDKLGRAKNVRARIGGKWTQHSCKHLESSAQRPCFCFSERLFLRSRRKSTTTRALSQHNMRNKLNLLQSRNKPNLRNRKNKPSPQSRSRRNRRSSNRKRSHRSKSNRLKVRNKTSNKTSNNKPKASR